MLYNSFRNGQSMDDRKKIISISSGCYNEADNLAEFYERWRRVLDSLPDYDYEFVIADNDSTDGSRGIRSSGSSSTQAISDISVRLTTRS